MKLIQISLIQPISGNQIEVCKADRKKTRLMSDMKRTSEGRPKHGSPRQSLNIHQEKQDQQSKKIAANVDGDSKGNYRSRCAEDTSDSTKLQLKSTQKLSVQMLSKEKQTKLDNELRAQLTNFEQLISQFTYGAPLVERNGGHHIDKGVHQQPQQSTRCSLLQAFTGGQAFPFGPLTNSKALVTVPSEGEESEVDITDFLMLPSNSNQQQQQQSSTQQSRPWSVQEAWSQAPAQATMQLNLDKLHPHNQKLLSGRIALEEKGGPRIRDVLEQLVDLKSLRPFTSLKQLPAEHVYSGQLSIYLILSGLDHYQKATQISRRLKSWLTVYDNTSTTHSLSYSQQAQYDTRPSVIHVYPNTKLASLSALQLGQKKQSSSDQSPDANPQRDYQRDYQRGRPSQSTATDTICLVSFHDPAALEHVYRVLRDAQKKQGMLNEAKQPIRCGMAYDARCLGETAWTGVILRNLPHNATSQGVKNNFMQAAEQPKNITEYAREALTPDSLRYHILDLLEPVKIRGHNCTVLTVSDVEEAERICQIWNRFELDKQLRLKAHLHPYSYRKRPEDKLSVHPIFKDRYNPSQVLKSEVSDNRTTPIAPPLPQEQQQPTQPPPQVVQQKETSIVPAVIKTEVNHEAPQKQMLAQTHSSPPPKTDDVTMKQESSPGPTVVAAEPQAKLIQPKPKGLLALVDAIEEPKPLKQQQSKVELKQVKAQQQPTNGSGPQLACMDMFFEDDEQSKKKKVREKRAAIQRRREREQHLQLQMQQQAEKMIGKKRQRDELQQSKIDPAQLKRVKREEASLAAGPIIKDELSQGDGTSSAKKQD